jgi:Alpha/beta hydrolase
MTVSVADIDRWDSGDLREVFHATRSRAEAAAEASNGMARLPAFQTWGGDAADAAKDAIGKTRRDLDEHGNEALAVGRAADRAADQIEDVKSRLANLRERAHQLGMELNPFSNSFVPAAGSTMDPADVALAEAELQPQLTALLAEAAAIDDELAAAINMATGQTPIPTEGPPVGPEGLTPTQITSDANEARLESERSRVQGDVDRMQRQLDEWARQAYMGNPDVASKDQMAELAAKLSEQKKYLGDLDSVHEALGKADETYLTAFDPRTGTGKPVLAAVAVGNPDTAKNVSVTVPGVGSTTEDSLPSMVSEANALRAETLRQLHLEGLPESAATIAWMGYDPPPNPINTMSPADAIATMNDGQAVPGAHSLSNYLEQLHQNNPDGHLTLFGHSYGSLTSSLALQELNAQGLHPVDDVVFYGSPGLELSNPSQLGIPDGHAFAMRGETDPIAGIVAELAPAHGWGINPYDGSFPQLSADAGVDPGGVLRDGVQSHADYPRLGSGDQLRMSGYNLAAVLAGIPDNQVIMPKTLPLPLPHIVPGGQVPLPTTGPGR